jgi:hypothetical protein
VWIEVLPHAHAFALRRECDARLQHGSNSQHIFQEITTHDENLAPLLLHRAGNSDNTKGCYDVINNAKPIMMEACTAVLESRAKRGANRAKEPFVIADYGAADAGTSLPLMHEMVAMIRKAEPDSPVVLAYEDQPQNDWTSVFRRLLGQIPSQVCLGNDVHCCASSELFPFAYPLKCVCPVLAGSTCLLFLLVLCSCAAVSFHTCFSS